MDDKEVKAKDWEGVRGHIKKKKEKTHPQMQKNNWKKKILMDDSCSKRIQKIRVRQSDFAKLYIWDEILL